MNPRGLRQVFAVPAVVAVASVVGLLSALVGDGVWDAVSWLGLGLAVGLAGWHGVPWAAASRGRLAMDCDPRTAHRRDRR